MKQVNHFKRRIRKHFEAATDDQYIQGLKWYHEAHEFCVGVSKRYQVPLIKVVGILAALSPNNKWDRNKIDLELFLEAPSVNTKVCTFKGQREKALRIYHSVVGPKQVKEILKGVKTCNFFENIYDYKGSKAVTVDLWMFRSCNVEPLTKYIKDITKATLEVSEELELAPHQLQAVVWSSVRGSHE